MSVVYTLAWFALVVAIALAAGRTSRRISRDIDAVIAPTTPRPAVPEHPVHAHVVYPCTYCRHRVTLCTLDAAEMLRLIAEPMVCPDCTTIAQLDRQVSTP